jgi:hypothetical protein
MEKIPLRRSGSRREELALILLRAVFVLGFWLFLAHTSPAQTPGSQTDETSREDSSYGGPSILSRGLLPSIRSRNADIAFRPYIGVSAVCDSALTGVSVDSRGHPPNLSQCGVEGSAGITGYHRWKKTNLGLTYNGDYYHYFKNSYYDNSDQTLSLEFRHHLSKHLILGLREGAGTYSRSYGYAPGSVFFDPASLPISTTDLFDNRVIYLSTAADLTYIRSARWSFNFGGEGYLVRRRSTSLYGVTVGGATADVVYRYSRFGSIGASYQYEQYTFTKAFGSSDIHVGAVQYALRVSRSWEFSASVGGARVETLGFAIIQIDPVIAAITGQTQGIAAVYRINYLPSLGASLTKSFRNAGLNFRYSRGISPGNGVYLTSSQETATVGFNYGGVRHWSFSASGGYFKLISLVQTLGQYRSYMAGVSASRSLTGGLAATFRLEGNRYGTNSSLDFRRNAYRVALGLTWSPGEIPVTLW